MRKYLALVKVQFKQNFAYRLSTVASIVVGIFQVFIYYYIWRSVYGGEVEMKGFSFQQICTYVILSNVLFRLIEFGITLQISDLVRTGEIAVKLTKPINFISSLFFESIGSLASTIFTLVIPILIICLFMIPFYWQTNIIVILLFFISLFMGIIISSYIDIIFGLLTFWTENGWGLRVIRQAMFKLFSGTIVPLVFLPGWFNKLCDKLPFKTLIDTPIRIYIYGVDKKVLSLMIDQLIWGVVLFLITHFLYKVIIKKMQMNGG